MAASTDDSCYVLLYFTAQRLKTDGDDPKDVKYADPVLYPESDLSTFMSDELFQAVCEEVFKGKPAFKNVVLPPVPKPAPKPAPKSSYPKGKKSGPPMKPKASAPPKGKKSGAKRPPNRKPHPHGKPKASEVDPNTGDKI